MATSVIRFYLFVLIILITNIAYGQQVKNDRTAGNKEFRAEYDRVAAKIKSQFGISPMNLWWSTTHTHSAPECGKAGHLGEFRVLLGDKHQFIRC